jgi:hypothetical protein
VGQSSAPRPRSPGGQSPARLLRGLTPSENTGLTARRPKGHDNNHKTSEMVSSKVSMKVRWGSDGEEMHGHRKRAVSPEYGSQGQDHEDLQVRTVSMKVRWGSDGEGKRGHWERAVSPEYGRQGQDHEDLQVRKVSIQGQRHEGGLPRLVSPSNDAIHPRRGGQPEVPEPRRARRRMYGRGYPTTMCNYVKISLFILVLLNWMAVVQSTKPTPGQQGPRCFLAVPQRRGWWNTKEKHKSGHKTRIREEARGAHTKTTGTQIDLMPIGD